MAVRTFSTILLTTLLLLSQPSKNAQACDPLGCLVIGKEQDALLLVTVTDIENEIAATKINHVYARRKSSIKSDVDIKFNQDTQWNAFLPDIGDHYLVSISCPEKTCDIKWGAWEVDRADYKTAKLLQIRHGDDAAIQWLLNENGNEFYGVENKMFAKTAHGDIEIYPTHPSRTTESLTSDNLSPFERIFSDLSMIFIIVSVAVPILIWLFFPSILQKLTHMPVRRDGVLALACLIYFISWYLPSPLIHGENTAFTTHFIGGGIFTGLVWLFAKRQLQWKTSWLMELITLYAAVSALGVANELFELFVAESRIVPMTGRDTWWDLLANTSGALFLWIIYRLISKTRAINA